jgi:hypothetical protein
MSEIEAAKTVRNFFDAFNAQDDWAYQQAHNFPHIRINDQGDMSIVMNAKELLPIQVVADYLRRNQDWHHSTLDSLKAIHVSPSKVHFDIEFSRYNSKGERYTGYKALWVVTEKDGHWGILVRSTYAPFQIG